MAPGRKEDFKQATNFATFWQSFRTAKTQRIFFKFAPKVKNAKPEPLLQR